MSTRKKRRTADAAVSTASDGKSEDSASSESKSRERKVKAKDPKPTSDSKPNSDKSNSRKRRRSTDIVEDESSRNSQLDADTLLAVSLQFETEMMDDETKQSYEPQTPPKQQKSMEKKTAQSPSRNLFQLLSGRSFASPSTKTVMTNHMLARIKTFQLTSTTRLFDDRAQVMALHPTELMTAMGSKAGDVVVWRLPAQDSIEEDVPASSLLNHNGRVSEVLFHPCDSNLVLSSSFAGQVCSVDLSHQAATPDVLLAADSKFTSLAVSRRNAVYAGDEAGIVHIRDMRSNAPQQLQLHRKRVATISFNPASDNLLVTSANIHLKGCALCIWDTRKLGPNAMEPVQVIPYNRVVHAASFSATGSRFLTTSLDDTITVYTASGQSLTQLSAISHKTQTGIWISDFRPQFYPYDDNLLVTGEIRSHKVVLYDCSKAKRVHEFGDEHLSGVTSLAAFHPRHDVMVSVSYGKASVWQQLGTSH